MRKFFQSLSQTETCVYAHLPNLIELLNVYCESSASKSTPLIYMNFPGRESSLLLEIIEKSIVTSCTLRTRDFDSHHLLHNLEFNRQKLVCKIILRSDVLRCGLFHIDWKSFSPSSSSEDSLVNTMSSGISASEAAARSTIVQLRIQTHKQQAENEDNQEYIPISFSVSSRQSGNVDVASMSVDFAFDPHAREGTNQQVFYDCSVQKDLAFAYRWSQLDMIMKALENSDRTCLRVDNEGVLSLQHMIRTDGTRYVVLEFNFLSINQEREDGEEDGE